MKYPHRLRIWRDATGTGGNAPAAPAGGTTTNMRTGRWTPAAPAGSAAAAAAERVVYDGAADVQDRGRTIQRNEEGQPTLRSDAVAFLEDESTIGDIQDGDRARVTWEDGKTLEGRVSRVVRLDGSVDLERL